MYPEWFHSSTMAHRQRKNLQDNLRPPRNQFRGEDSLGALRVVLIRMGLEHPDLLVERRIRGWCCTAVGLRLICYTSYPRWQNRRRCKINEVSAQPQLPRTKMSSTLVRHLAFHLFAPRRVKPKRNYQRNSWAKMEFVFGWAHCHCWENYFRCSPKWLSTRARLALIKALWPTQMGRSYSALTRTVAFFIHKGSWKHYQPWALRMVYDLIYNEIQLVKSVVW